MGKRLWRRLCKAFLQRNVGDKEKLDMLFINKILMEWMRIGAKANISLGFLYLDKKFAD